MSTRKRRIRRLFISKTNKIAGRIHANSNELENTKHEMPGGPEYLVELIKQIGHDKALLSKESKKRGKGVRGMVRALVSWRAYRNLRELKKIRSGDDFLYVTAKYGLRRSHELSRKYWSGAASVAETEEYHQLKKSRPHYARVVNDYESLLDLKRKRAERKAAKREATSPRTSERK